MDTDFLCTQAICDDLDETNEEENDFKEEVGLLKILPNKKVGLPAIEFPIYKGENVIGRHTNCSICIPWSIGLSKKHAVIEADSESYLVYDCGSSNKTRMGKMKLKPNVRYGLRDGDEVTFGDVRSIFVQISKKTEESSLSKTPSGNRQLLLAADTPENFKDTKHDELDESTATIPESQPISLETPTCSKSDGHLKKVTPSSAVPLHFDIDETLPDEQMVSNTESGIAKCTTSEEKGDVSHITETDSETDYHLDSDTDIEDEEEKNKHKEVEEDVVDSDATDLYDADTAELDRVEDSDELVSKVKDPGGQITSWARFPENEEEDEEEDMSLLTNIDAELTQPYHIQSVKNMGSGRINGTDSETDDDEAILSVNVTSISEGESSAPLNDSRNNMEEDLDEKPGCSKIMDMVEPECPTIPGDPFDDVCTQAFPQVIFEKKKDDEVYNSRSEAKNENLAYGDTLDIMETQSFNTDASTSNQITREADKDEDEDADIEDSMLFNMATQAFPIFPNNANQEEDPAEEETQVIDEDLFCSDDKEHPVQKKKIPVSQEAEKFRPEVEVLEDTEPLDTEPYVSIVNISPQKSVANAPPLVRSRECTVPLSVYFGKQENNSSPKLDKKHVVDQFPAESKVLPIVALRTSSRRRKKISDSEIKKNVQNNITHAAEVIASTIDEETVTLVGESFPNLQQCISVGDKLPETSEESIKPISEKEDSRTRSSSKKSLENSPPLKQGDCDMEEATQQYILQDAEAFGNKGDRNTYEEKKESVVYKEDQEEDVAVTMEGGETLDGVNQEEECESTQLYIRTNNSNDITNVAVVQATETACPGTEISRDSNNKKIVDSRTQIIPKNPEVILTKLNSTEFKKSSLTDSPNLPLKDGPSNMSSYEERDDLEPTQAYIKIPSSPGSLPAPTNDSHETSLSKKDLDINSNELLETQAYINTYPQEKEESIRESFSTKKLANEKKESEANISIPTIPISETISEAAEKFSTAEVKRPSSFKIPREQETEACIPITTHPTESKTSELEMNHTKKVDKYPEKSISLKKKTVKTKSDAGTKNDRRVRSTAQADPDPKKPKSTSTVRSVEEPRRSRRKSKKTDSDQSSKSTEDVSDQSGCNSTPPPHVKRGRPSKIKENGKSEMEEDPDRKDSNLLHSSTPPPPVKRGRPRKIKENGKSEMEEEPDKKYSNLHPIKDEVPVEFPKPTTRRKTKHSKQSEKIENVKIKQESTENHIQESEVASVAELDFALEKSKTKGRKRKKSSIGSNPSTSVKKEPQTPAKKVKAEEEDDIDLNRSFSLALRPRKEKPRVMFTGVLDNVAEQIILELGGKMTLDIHECTHLITDKMRRTIKFLCAVVRGLHIVTPQWLYQSKNHGRFLEEDEFQLTEDTSSPDDNLEQKYNFSLQNSLQVARLRTEGLFQGLSIFVTKNVVPPSQQMLQIVECGGANILSKMPKNVVDSSSIVIVATSRDKSACSSALKAGCRVVNNEFVLTGVLQQRVDFDTHSMFDSCPSSQHDAVKFEQDTSILESEIPGPSRPCKRTNVLNSSDSLKENAFPPGSEELNTGLTKPKCAKTSVAPTRTSSRKTRKKIW